MPYVTFVTHQGQEFHVESLVGQSVMQAAVNNMIPGIIADCGGSCACATCHVYVDEPWGARISAAAPAESDMIECAAGVQANSRLSCCIRLSPELDGIVVRIPESQY